MQNSLYYIHCDRVRFFAGSYIFIESSGKNTGDKARLLSGWIEPNEVICVQFWYHMHGSDIGKLNIYLKTNQSETLVWSLSGDQGNRWRFGQTALNSPSLYKVSCHSYDHIQCLSFLFVFPLIRLLPKGKSFLAVWN